MMNPNESIEDKAPEEVIRTQEGKHDDMETDIEFFDTIEEEKEVTKELPEAKIKKRLPKHWKRGRIKILKTVQKKL